MVDADTFLKGGWEEELDGDEQIEAWVEGTGWKSHMVWGFEEIDGEKRFVRRGVFRAEKGTERWREVWDWMGR